ncbi:MAG: ABC transporter permease [Phycisphaerae bacterium]|jgi:ABC-2 type transport system permease protein
MDKVLTVAIREFLETVRTKAFFITVVLMPLLVLGFMFGADWIGKLTEDEQVPPRHIALVDHTGLLAEPLGQQFEQYNAANPKRTFVLEEQPADADLDALSTEVRKGDLYGYLVVPVDALGASDACQLARRDQQIEAGKNIERLLNEAVFVVRCQQAEPPLDPQAVRALRSEVPMLTVDLETGAATGREMLIARLLTPFAAMFLLFMGVMQISYGLLTSVLEEKSSRVIEVLLSAVSPLQLMAGKILGMVAVGVLLLCVWGGVGYAVAQARGMGQLVSWQFLAAAALYFVPGFLLFSAILAGIGSACNTLKEAQSMASPVTILNIVPMVLWFPISQSPDSAFSVVLSFIPPITPFVMILRTCVNPHIPLWQLVGTQVVLWASVVVAVWAAAKVFRVGILMYGKPPSLSELLRWVRYA